MSDPREVGRDLEPDGVGSYGDPLGRWERGLAVSIGVLAGGAGVYAVFASQNQAGTGALLIIALVFLLIGVQGTPLIRFASGSNAVELERRRRVHRALQQAAEEDNVDKAVGIIEGVAIAEPHLVPEGAVYKRRLTAAVMRLGYRVTAGTSGFDFLVQAEDNRRVFLEAKYYGERGSRVYNIFVSRLLMKIGPPDDRGRHGRRVLLVCNVPLSRVSEELVARENNVISFVVWRDESDNENLSAALLVAFAGR